jgi:hypothetical protein
LYLLLLLLLLFHLFYVKNECSPVKRQRVKEFQAAFSQDLSRGKGKLDVEI